MKPLTRSGIALLTSLLVASCGGGADPISPAPPPPAPPPPPPAPVVVTVTPATATVETGQTQQFTAVVANTTNQTVTWTATAGTLQPSGLTAAWTAPGTSGPATVTATSVADPTKSGSAAVTVPPPVLVPVASITLDRTAETLVAQQTVQVTAVLRDAAGGILTGRPIIWTTTTAAVASVSDGGLITAVAPGTATISATSEGKTAVVAITVVQGGMVSTGGGTVATTDGAVVVTVPAGAVSSAAALTIAPVLTPVANPLLAPGTAFEFGPSQAFAQPVTIRIKYAPAQLPANVGAATLRLHRLTAGVWVEVPGSSVDPGTNTVSGQTSSFSQYALVGKPPVQEMVITWGIGQSGQCAAGSGLQCGVTPGGGWIVPEDVYTATFELYGASGGGMGGAGTGGKGGKTVATIAVYPGESFQIRTGAAGNFLGAFNGGGRGGYGTLWTLGGVLSVTDGRAGGGATDVRRGAVVLQDFPGYTGRILVAGGGGGDAGPVMKYTSQGSTGTWELLGPGAPGGPGGGLVGGDGGNGTALSYEGVLTFTAPTGGKGGSTLQPGSAGISSNWLGFATDKFIGQPADADLFWGGGRGGHAQVPGCSTGNCSLNGNGGGGGGGGWQGGGGGGATWRGDQLAAGGGGGSSWGPLGTTFEQGVHTGHGKAVLTFTPSPGLIPTVTTGTPSVSPVPSGSPFTISATVALKPPAQGPVTGSVRFEVDGQMWGGAPVPLQGGQAVSAPISGLSPGLHTITVSFLGNGNLAPSGTTFLVAVSQ